MNVKKVLKWGSCIYMFNKWDRFPQMESFFTNQSIHSSLSKKSQNGEVGGICLISMVGFPKSRVFLQMSSLSSFVFKNVKKVPKWGSVYLLFNK